MTARHPPGRPEGGQFTAPGDSAAVTAAAEQAAQARADHYEQRTHAQGGACGDPVAVAGSTMQPEIGQQAAGT